MKFSIEPERMFAYIINGKLVICSEERFHTQHRIEFSGNLDKIINGLITLLSGDIPVIEYEESLMKKVSC